MRNISTANTKSPPGSIGGVKRLNSWEAQRTVALFWAAKPRLMPLVWAYGPKSWMQNLNLSLSVAALGKAAFAKAVEQRRLMTMEQAIAYALKDQE